MTTAAEVYRAYNEAENRHDWDATTALLAADVDVVVNGTPEVASAEDDRRAMAELVTVFPDYRREVLEIVGEGDRAAVRWVMRATTSPSAGVALRVEGASFIAVRDGRITRAVLVSSGEGLDLALARARGDR